MSDTSDKVRQTVDVLNKDLLDVKKRLEKAEELLQTSPDPQNTFERYVENDLNDPRYDDAVTLVKQQPTINSKFLQEALGIGEIRASRLISKLETNGIIKSSGNQKQYTVLNKDK